MRFPNFQSHVQVAACVCLSLSFSASLALAQTRGGMSDLADYIRENSIGSIIEQHKKSGGVDLNKATRGYPSHACAICNSGLSCQVCGCHVDAGSSTPGRETRSRSDIGLRSRGAFGQAAPKARSYTDGRGADAAARTYRSKTPDEAAGPQSRVSRAGKPDELDLWRYPVLGGSHVALICNGDRIDGTGPVASLGPSNPRGNGNPGIVYGAQNQRALPSDASWAGGVYAPPGTCDNIRRSADRLNDIPSKSYGATASNSNSALNTVLRANNVPLRPSNGATGWGTPVLQDGRADYPFGYRPITPAEVRPATFIRRSARP